GAVTALGDTLFPADSLSQGLSQDLSPTAHFLIRLRLFHPAIAIIAVVYSIFSVLLTRFRYPSIWIKRFALIFAIVSLAQLAVGLLNVFLLAPTWLQQVHLLMADLVWITLVLLTAAAVAKPAAQPLMSMKESVDMR